MKEMMGALLVVVVALSSKVGLSQINDSGQCGYDVNGTLITFTDDSCWYQVVDKSTGAEVCKDWSLASCAIQSNVAYTIARRDRNWGDAGTVNLPADSRNDSIPVNHYFGGCEEIIFDDDGRAFQNTGCILPQYFYQEDYLGYEGSDGICHSDPINHATPLRRIVEHCGFDRPGFLIGFAMKDNFGSTWFDRAEHGCFPEGAISCENGEIGNAYAHKNVGLREFNIMTLESKQKMNLSQSAEPTLAQIGNSNTEIGFTRNTVTNNTDNTLINMGFYSGQMALHGHAIAFETAKTNSVIPGWFFNITKSKAISVMKDRIQRELRHYKGTNIPYWDVANEFLKSFITSTTAEDVAAFRNDPGKIDRIMKQGGFYDQLGKDWVEKLLIWGHEELDTWEDDIQRPALILNEVYVAWENNKSNALYELVRYLNRDPNNQLVDGVGFQAHFWTDGRQNSPSGAQIDSVGANMRRFTDNLNVDVYITEMDVRIPDKNNASFITDAEHEEQSSRYGKMLAHCLENSRCKAFQVWGMTDWFNWRPEPSAIFSGQAFSLDGSGANNSYTYKKKPAYRALHEALARRVQ